MTNGLDIVLYYLASRQADDWLRRVQLVSRRRYGKWWLYQTAFLVVYVYKHSVVIRAVVAGYEHFPLMPYRHICSDKTATRSDRQWGRLLIETDPQHVLTCSPGVILPAKLIGCIQTQKYKTIIRTSIGVGGRVLDNYLKSKFIRVHGKPEFIIRQIGCEFSANPGCRILGMAQPRLNYPITLSGQARNIGARAANIQCISYSTVD